MCGLPDAHVLFLVYRALSLQLRATGVLLLPFQFHCWTSIVWPLLRLPIGLLMSAQEHSCHLESPLCIFPFWFILDPSRALRFSSFLLIKIKQSISFPSITLNSLCNSIIIATLASALRGRWQERHIAKMGGIVCRGTLCTWRWWHSFQG